MRLTVGIAILLTIVAYATPAKAQVITAGPDSVLVPLQVADTATTNDRTFFLSKWNKPAKAALFSAVVPGMGQAYNKAYWKMPIVYATGAVLAYFWIDNHTKYQDFREGLNLRLRDSSDVYVDHRVYGLQRTNGTANMRRARDYYRRNRDLTILLSIGAYGLQVAEAYVHAHMKEFDISEDLAFKVKPHLVPDPFQRTYTPGLSITLYTKK